MELRKLREGRELTSEAAAAEMGWHPSKMSRLEGGRSGLRGPDVGRLLDLYGISDAGEREALADLAREGRRRVWWQPYNDVLAKHYASFISFEVEASAIRNYQVSAVPGLLQTADYARVLTRSSNPEYSPEDVNALVEVRLARQNAAWEREEPLKLWAILDEAVVHRAVGGPAAMAKQLQRLIAASEMPNITLQILPFTAGAHAGMPAPFLILGFPVRDDLDVVYLESHTSSLYLEREEDLEHYGRAFDLMRAAALDIGPSRDLMARLVRKLD
ncbi:helix-turn-helix transcriptional regulator [Streptomyces sp. A3M-1-3]|uniref:helix-turn-helix domain-containing protein n=1 Tax=Streptomyces sp. A3M-1-3 TaxID=2962044 RepID=UPI0027E5347F|nr:helix-turn-helix transcriptional regulator [Streptomyces sp. A3M-1-3]